MQFQMTVIQVSEAKDKKNNKGGTFNACDVVYKRDGKVEAKSFPDWANKDIYPTLLALEKDVTYTVTTEKVGDFWKWLSISRSDTNAAADTSGGVVQSPAAVGVSSSRPQAAAGKILGSNYETREERQQRQKLIVAQSSLSAAIELTSSQKIKASPEETTELAEKFYNWVFAVATKDLSDIESDQV